ncbi:MAG: hypothetical protein K2Y16_07385 [Burkholderiales bacterium]|nr:hypothetical protein [Burkholderiales bacterium]
MKKTLLYGVIAASAWVTLPVAAEPGFSLTTGLDYSTGKYGGATSTDILYVPFTGKYEADKYSLKLTVPYLQITGPGNVVRDVGQIRSSTSTTRTTQSGLGDIVAAGTYNMYDGRANGTLVDVTAKIKFGTADDAKGLGTGKNDYALQADLYKTLGKNTVFGTLGYKVMGSPAGVTLNNVFYASLGAGHKYSQETSAGLILDLREKASATGFAQRELTAYVSHKLGKTWKAQAYAVKGFSDGSPDWGAGAMFTAAF